MEIRYTLVQSTALRYDPADPPRDLDVDTSFEFFMQGLRASLSIRFPGAKITVKEAKAPVLGGLYVSSPEDSDESYYRQEILRIENELFYYGSWRDYHKCAVCGDQPAFMGEPGAEICGRPLCSECENELRDLRDSARSDGYDAGYGAGNYMDFDFQIGDEIDDPDVDVGTIESEDDLENAFRQAAWASEQNARQFSPWEFTAKALNDGEAKFDVEGDLWELYDEGVDEGISDAWGEYADQYLETDDDD